MILSDYSIKFRTAVFVFIVVIVLAGISNYMRLPREGSPDITIPFVFVAAFYEGTAPAEMEKLVTIPLEKSLNDLENVKEVRSTTSESLCAVSIEFMAGEDIDMARQRVKDKVDLAKPDLPDDLEEPTVDAFNFSSDAPIFKLALSGRTGPERLKNLAEDVRDQIETLPGVKEASVVGVREREIRVELDLPRLIAYGVPLGVVMQRIAAENSTVSAGNIEMEGDKFQIRIPGEFELVAELRDLILQERDGHPVYLRDIAEVRDTYKDLDSISRLNGDACVSISVTKRSRENSVALIDQMKAVLGRMSLPPEVTSTIVYDESDYVDMMIGELENNIATGFLLVIVVLVVFMGWRNSLFVALAIPFSLLIAFTLISLMGLTLNMIVLFSLVLSVGMLVDNAIVIVENIYRNRTLGLSRVEAARKGASEVAWPVITSTLTTCAAFAPLLFWPDIMGQFMGFMPKTLILTLSASLFVAIVINPAVCSVFITGGKRRGERAEAAEPERESHPFVKGYECLVRGALRHRVPVLLIGFFFLILTVQLYGRMDLGVELFPETEPRNAMVQLRFPQGTSIERTDAAMRSIEEKLRPFQDIQFFLTSVGAGSGEMFSSATGGHQGSIHIEFLPSEEREGNTMELVSEIREAIGAIPGAEIKVDRQEEGPPTGDPVAIELSGDDFDVLADYANEITRAIETVPGLVDLQDDLEDALPELQFRVDRKRAALMGLDTGTIGLFLRAAVYGLESSKFRADEDEYDITLRLPESQRSTARMLSEIFIPVPGGASVPLSSLGHVEYRGGKGSIKRKNQKRVITVSGNNQVRGVAEILEDIRPRIEKIRLPRGYHIDYTGDHEEMKKSMDFLSRAFGIAVGLILVILVIQFNSALLPGIIVSTVVLSLAGVMWGLMLCRMRFCIIMTGLGVISLAGIVVNNAIVLIDCIIQRRTKDGLSTYEAVVAAGRMRLRPVLLTAVTTILGLIPMVIGYSLEIHEWPPRIIAGAETSEWWAPMAVSVIFGLGIATVLTLVLIPVMYSLVDSFVGVLRRVFGGEPEGER